MIDGGIEWALGGYRPLGLLYNPPVMCMCHLMMGILATERGLA